MGKPSVIAIVVLLVVVIGYLALRYGGRQPEQPDRVPANRPSSLLRPHDRVSRGLIDQGAPQEILQLQGAWLCPSATKV